MRIITEFLRRAALAVAALGCAGPVVADLGRDGVRYGVVYGARVKLTAPEPSALALRIGQPDSLDELVERLLRVAEEFVGRAPGLQRPRVTLIEAAALQAKLCGAPCTVKAAYVPGEGLFIDRQLRPDVNLFHQSILFHELVHHVQVAHGLYRALGGCSVWQARESQAYALQNRFLSALGAAQRALDPAIPCVAEPRGAQTFESPAD
jgi:hypothetical protein